MADIHPFRAFRYDPAVEIANLDATGVSDFSAAGIAARRNAGYDAAQARLSSLAVGAD